MAGHSKWAQIKRKKGANDKKRSAVISKHIRAISVAVRAGGSGDPAANLSLKNAIAAAKTDTVPVDNIDNAIKRAVGEGEGGVNYKEVVYEGYGQGGVALLVETLTDNVNRTIAEIRNVFNKRGGSLGNSGSVAWQFEKKGIVQVAQNSAEAQETAIELGAEDMEENPDGSLTVYTSRGDLFTVSEGLSQAGIAVTEASLQNIAQNTIDVTPEDAEKLMTLIEALEDLDDVQTVTSNANFDDFAE